MDWVKRYLQMPYVEGGRTETEMDCWGLVIHARQEAGFKPLPAYGAVRRDNGKAFTRAYGEGASLLEPCEAEHGAIAAVLHGKVCVHVALVLEHRGELWVLETNPVRGPRFIRHNTWIRDHLTVTYHRDAHDKGLSEQTDGN